MRNPTEASGINPYACPRCGDHKRQTMVREDYLGSGPDGHVFVESESEAVLVTQIWDCPNHGSHSHVVTDRSTEAAIMPGSFEYIRAKLRGEHEPAG